MPVSLATVRYEVRTMLDEKTKRFWDDVDLNMWINEAARDVARRTETLETFISFPAIPTVPFYPMPFDFLRSHRMEFQNQVTNAQPITYPLEQCTINEMDQYWGSMQYQQRAYPTFVAFWGQPPAVTAKVFPVPSQAGYFNLYYYQLPPKMNQDTDLAVIPEGWYDLLATYCEYRAMQKDRDQRWQDFKQLYEEGIAIMIDMTRRHHDQTTQFVTRGRPGGSFPYGWGDW